MKILKQIKWYVIFSIALALPYTSQAVTITLDGTDYVISTLTGTFNANSTILESQPWWGDLNLATVAANQVNTSDFSPTPENILFAFGVHEFSTVLFTWPGASRHEGLGIEDEKVYAVATTIESVTEAGVTGTMLVGALLGLAALRRTQRAQR